LESTLAMVEAKITSLRTFQKKLQTARMMTSPEILFGSACEGKMMICDEGKAVYRCDGGVFSEVPIQGFHPYRLAKAGQPMETGVNHIVFQLMDDATDPDPDPDHRMQIYLGVLRSDFNVDGAISHNGDQAIHITTNNCTFPLINELPSGSLVGLTLNLNTMHLSFSVNGQFAGMRSANFVIPPGPLVFFVGMYERGDRVRIVH